MTTEDIDYSTPGTVGIGPLGRRIPRKDVRDPLYIDDIKGIRPNNTYRSTFEQNRVEGSYKRNTDPLDPDYDYLG